MAKKNPRLQFTDAELNPKLRHHARRAGKAADQAERARAKLPKDKKKRRRRMTSQHMGPAAPGKRLYFAEVDKPKPPSKLSHALQQAPGLMVSGAVHREVQQAEQDNVGLESIHKLELAAETAGRIAESAYHAHKLRPYRQAAKAERRLEKANVKLLYQKHIQDNPQLASSPLSRWQQKRAIRKQYASAVSSGQSAAATMESTARAAKRAAEKSRRTTAFFIRHRSVVGVIITIFFTLSLLLNVLSSCTALVQGGLSVLSITTFPSADADMLGAEAAYVAMEDELRSCLDNFERTHSYDAYRYELDEIGHDPYVLMALLNAYHRGGWTLEQVQGTLEMLFERQYTLTETVTVETRYDEDDEPYEYSICTVTLDNFDLSHLPVYLLDEEGMNIYAVYIATLGNRPDLFPTSEYPNASQRQDYLDYDVPPEALEDEVFAAMLAEAEKYLGYPYVWGGSSPSTSFDCSGFVSWVINHSGWNYGRLGAQGLCNVCTPVSPANARPGDLVFFKYTYDAPNPDGVTHCGIYVGNGMMIHCGSPISYADLNTSYWQAHFYCYGRLPEP